MKLPVEFEKRMQEYLGEEADSFLASYSEEEIKSLRINRVNWELDGSDAEFQDVLNKKTDIFQKVQWNEDGYYYDSTAVSPGKHPYHEAGVYYIQEASAMAPVKALGVMPGDRVLDLCAAPGGKSTQIGSDLRGKGILVSNEIVPSRAKILSENIERMGIRNALVVSEDPRKLSEKFPEYFDRILVDAPCSGEGMFRRSDVAITEWSAENVKLCAERQEWILDEAYKMLAPGGRLVYSTCTFAKEEDELGALAFISRHSDMKSIKVSLDGLSDGFDGIGYRVWPHIQKGEGHYLCVFEKDSINNTLKNPPSYGFEKGISQKEKDNLKEAFKFMAENTTLSDWILKGTVVMFGENIYRIPDECPSLKGMKVLRPGLQIGSLEKGRFIPSHSLAMALTEKEAVNVCRVGLGVQKYPVVSDVIYKYFRGETFNIDEGMVGNDYSSGWYLITVDGFSAGWGKLTGSVMKNHYPKGLRKNF